MPPVAPRARLYVFVLVAFGLLVPAHESRAQTQPADLQVPVPSKLPAPVLVPLSGVALTTSGDPRTGEITLHLALYATQDDQEPLWSEDQSVTLGPGGFYQVWIGGTQVAGLPAQLFTESASRWVGVQIENDPQLPRALIVASPYAARAASADALGARTANEYVLSENLAQLLKKWGFTPPKSPKDPKDPKNSDGDVGIMSLSTGDATTPNAIAKYLDNIGTLGQANSLFESNGKFGVGVSTPALPLTIYGPVGAPAGSGTQQTGVLRTLYSNSVGLDIGAFSTAPYAPWIQTVDTTNLAATYPLALNPLGGNVGVGTASPAQRLTVFGANGSPASSGTTQAGVMRLAYTNSVGLDFGGMSSAPYSPWIQSVDTTNLSGTYPLALNPSGGNVGIGTMSPTTTLHVAGSVTADGNVRVGGASGIQLTRDAGFLVVNGSLRATHALEAKYQDVAEWVDTPETIEPGTVVIVDPNRDNNVIPATRAYDTRVAGAVSRQPGLVLGEPTANGSLVAQSGRVRIKADARYGAIRKGDLLVTSATRGHVMRSQPIRVGGRLIHRPGRLVGKALEALPAGTGEILVLLTLQ